MSVVHPIIKSPRIMIVPGAWVGQWSGISASPHFAHAAVMATLLCLFFTPQANFL